MTTPKAAPSTTVVPSVSEMIDALSNEELQTRLATLNAPTVAFEQAVAKAKADISAARTAVSDAINRAGLDPAYEPQITKARAALTAAEAVLATEQANLTRSHDLRSLLAIEQRRRERELTELRYKVLQDEALKDAVLDTKTAATLIRHIAALQRLNPMSGPLNASLAEVLPRIVSQVPTHLVMRENQVTKEITEALEKGRAAMRDASKA